MQQIKELVKNLNYEECIKLCEVLPKGSPTIPVVYERMKRCNSMLNELEEAVERYNKVYENDMIDWYDVLDTIEDKEELQAMINEINSKLP